MDEALRYYFSKCIPTQLHGARGAIARQRLGGVLTATQYKHLDCKSSTSPFDSEWWTYSNFKLQELRPLGAAFPPTLVRSKLLLRLKRPEIVLGTHVGLSRIV